MSKTYIHGYKLKIYPDEEQSKTLDKFINLFRYVYNWGIAKQEEKYEQYKNGLSEYGFYSFIELCTLFTKERNKPENEWLKEIPLTTSRLALRNVINAYKKFFYKDNKHPKFKSKKKCKLSFNTRNDRFKLDNNRVRIEGMKSYIDLKFNSEIYYDGYNNKVINPTITKDNLGNYYISFSIEKECETLNIPKTEPIGIDLGIRKTFTLSTGEGFTQPKEKLKKLYHKRDKLQRHVTRDIKSRMKEAESTKTKYEDIPKSKRSEKRLNRLRKVYKKISNIKETFYNTISNQIITRNPEYVTTETFYVSDIIKNSRIKKLLDTSFYNITQIIKNKCEKYGILHFQAPTNYPSTQICSFCGEQKIMNSKHIYKCPNCGMTIDRDVNAAINLRDLYSDFI